ncbi:MAG: 4Fe-4S dicluster domain-containing protein, partial [Clostridia bacterium]|nr:4Fe-4S dicluster domain-containing protein [Clostridia bacterium]
INKGEMFIDFLGDKAGARLTYGGKFEIYDAKTLETIIPEYDIPSMFLFEGYFSRYDLKEWASKRYAGQPKHASDCIGCGVCEARCPYNLPIREMLRKVAAVMEKIE